MYKQLLLCAALISFDVQAQVTKDRPKQKQSEIGSSSLKEQISSYVGQVDAAETVQQIAPFAGRAVKQLVREGSEVKKGQPVLVISQRTLGETYANYTAKANISGVVNEYHVSPGFEFSSSSPLFTILDVSAHRIKLAVSNKDHKLITTNQSVVVVPEKTTNQILGKVRRKSLVPLAGSGLFTVEIDVPNTIPIGSFCEVRFQPQDSKVAQDQDSDTKKQKTRATP